MTLCMSNSFFRSMVCLIAQSCQRSTSAASSKTNCKDSFLNSKRKGSKLGQSGSTIPPDWPIQIRWLIHFILELPDTLAIAFLFLWISTLLFTSFPGLHFGCWPSPTWETPRRGADVRLQKLRHDSTPLQRHISLQETRHRISHR